MMQKLGVLQCYAQRNLDAERVLEDEFVQQYGTFRAVGGPLPLQTLVPFDST
jgi:hypothetical protein